MDRHQRRIVGIDYGTRRVGIAISDPLRLFAQPHGTFSPEDALTEVQKLAEREAIETVVVGWPLEPDGSEGPAVRRVLPFMNRIRKLLPEVHVLRWDERYSSQRAVEGLVAAGVPKSKRRSKGRIDRAAAGLILQEYLDENPPPAPEASPPSE